ncbi:PQQ-dependent sugar dehydrogenase [Niastella populi]|uniref:PQQ-dependent sugar dehydrogenase n=1 Tax=Niastella populi TaxID=550983 RepID=UPI001A9A02DE|nr:PQQ-dependent sugar dehydrogenase [Niastella populi]
MRKKISILFLLSFAACTGRKGEELQTIDNLQPANTLLKVEVLVSGMDVPWDLHYGSDDHLWVTEQGGNVWRIHPATGERKQVLYIRDVWRQRTTGLLGITLHPNFAHNPFVFLNYTLMRDSRIFSRLERYRFQNDTLVEPATMLEIGGNTGHNGSRITVSPDGKIMWATGDAHGVMSAQEDTCLNGKILRLDMDGNIPADNPDPKSYVWAKGFRNIQGLTYSDKGILYTSEHGDAIEDEINLIVKGANYGWPVVEGFHNLEKEQVFAAAGSSLEPLHAWTPVVAPSGMTFYNHPAIPEWTNSLLLGTLKTQSLRVLQLNDAGTAIVKEEVFFADRYGRIRDVCSGKDGAVYVSTSNRDWNPGTGFPKQGDDRILKITPAGKAIYTVLKSSSAGAVIKLNGQELYQQYCASCHKPEGTGVKGIFPALKNSAIVNGSAHHLIELLLKGKKGKDGSAMPAFSFLKDEEMTAVINYIRSSWGNKATAVSKKTITQTRR